MSTHLFSPLSLRDVVFRSRIVVSPMCEYSSTEGLAGEWHFVHLGSRAVGGAALVLTEAAAVTPEGRISASDLGIWSDRHAESLAPIFHFVERHGAVPGMQIAHAGRKASTREPWNGGMPVSPNDGGWSPIFGPSPIPFADGYQAPQEMSQTDLAQTAQAFADAAQRAAEAGAKVMEVHAAHGYLLHSFLSPLSNRRADNYGGSFANRARLLREVVAAIRGVWPERYPLFVRISATDWIEGGWTPQDSVDLALLLVGEGVDLIDCSSGGIVPNAAIPLRPGYQVPLAAQVKRYAGVPTGAVGLITEPAQADQIVRTGQADLVLLAREMLRNPYWPLHAATMLGQEGPWPRQYLRARNTAR